MVPLGVAFNQCSSSPTAAGSGIPSVSSTRKSEPEAVTALAAGGSSDSMSMALTTVTATSEALDTERGCQPPGGSTGLRHGGATSMCDRQVLDGTTNVAA